MTGESPPPASSADPYRSAGVDVAAGDRAAALLRGVARGAGRPEVVGELGGFAGLFRLDPARWQAPLLVASTDGVGTKVALARDMGVLGTVGIDLVAMVVDDLVVCGAEPLFVQDYLACGRVVPERVAEIVEGVAAGCRTAGCALLGGETAEHPGLLGPDDFDLAGTAVGVVEADGVLGADRVGAGDAVVALASSGLHSNGFSLVRSLLTRSGTGLDEPLFEGTVGGVLLTPTRIYARDCLAATATGAVHAFAHVTGGGLAANLARVLPDGTAALVDRSRAPLPAVFRWLAELGGLSTSELEPTLNMGVGMVAVVGETGVEAVLGVLADRGVPAWVCGEVGTAAPGGPRVELVGRYP